MHRSCKLPLNTTQQNLLVNYFVSLPEILEIIPKKFSDERGFFIESYHKKHFSEIGIHDCFIQDNHSFSIARGTIRGLHFQIAPYQQAKLIRVTRGSIFDVACDIRPQSRTFGCWISTILSSKECNYLYIPKGYAHGFCTLEDSTEIQYKVSEIYEPSFERGISYNDPTLAIPWPLDGLTPLLSKKDQNYPPI